MTNYKVELFSFHRMSEKKNLSIERKLTNQTVIAMFIFCLSTIYNAIGQYPPCSACQLELETRVHAKVRSHREEEKASKWAFSWLKAVTIFNCADVSRAWLRSSSACGCCRSRWRARPPWWRGGPGSSPACRYIVLLIVDTEDIESPELLVAPHCNHEAVEGAHRSEENQSDEPRADGDQLLRTSHLRVSVQQHC